MTCLQGRKANAVENVLSRVLSHFKGYVQTRVGANAKIWLQIFTYLEDS